jgi:hypothetical protein
VSILTNLLHRLTKKGDHLECNKKVVINKFKQSNPHANEFRIKEYTMDYCPACKKSYGNPEYNHEINGSTVKVQDKFYLEMITKGKKSIKTVSYPNRNTLVVFYN